MKFHLEKMVVFLFCVIISFIKCGGSSGDGATSQSEGESEESINTEKLINTPFEGLNTGDDFNEDFFLCGQYQTTQIDSFPIMIFTAFFTPSEEQVIQDGIDIANDAIGFTAYQLTNLWSEDLRIIYKVQYSDEHNFSGSTPQLGSSFQNTSMYFADYQNVDWVIELTFYGINKWIIAHELGHATGLEHWYYDDTTGERSDLEENSLMESNGNLPYSQTIALDDYKEMMSRKGEIMQYHLGQSEHIADEWLSCP